MDDRLSTGIEHLDEQIGGGVIPGSIVCLRLPSDSQGELLLKEVATANEGLYLSTIRTSTAIERWLSIDEVKRWLSIDEPDIDIQYVGIDELAPRGSKAIREWVTEAAGWYDDGIDDSSDIHTSIQIETVIDTIRSCEHWIVIDPVNPLERSDAWTYMCFLHQLRNHLQETGGVAFLHAVKTPELPNSRWLTVQMADVVWDISLQVRNNRIEFLLTVTKSRLGEVPNRQIKLDLEQDVKINTSRDIA